MNRVSSLTAAVAGPASTAGATFSTDTLAVATSHAPSASQTRKRGDTLTGPSRPAAEKVTSSPAVSKLPSPSRSHANDRASPSGSVPEPDRPTEPPSGTEYGRPASA